MVSLAVRQGETSVYILQGIRQGKLELKACDGIHVVHGQMDGSLFIAHTLCILYMQFVHGERVCLQCDGVQFRDIVAHHLHGTLHTTALRWLVGHIQFFSVSRSDGQREVGRA